jgi:endogenous inhibitor of DNA gyrase (YacG/DUF329 family)
MMRVGERHEMPEMRCTNCGKSLDRAAGIDNDARPEPGDASICIECGHLMTWGENMELRDPTTDEIIEFAGDPRIIVAQRARKLAREEE